MGRLIDADAFEKFIKDKYKDGESTDDIKDQMLFDLSYQPTAYDVENVVAELEEKQIDVDGNTSLHYLYSEGYHDGIDYAIDIVKAGGME